MGAGYELTQYCVEVVIWRCVHPCYRFSMIYTIALLCVATFVAGWATGRWDLLAVARRGIPSWLQGPWLLALCAGIVFVAVLYLGATPLSSRLLGPALLEQP